MLKQMQDAVCDCLQRGSGIHAVPAPAKHTGEYPLLSVDIRESGSTLLSGGTQAEERFSVTVTAARDRQRTGETGLLGSLVPVLLRGVPMEVRHAPHKAEKRVLHPLNLRTENEELTFDVALCVPVPPEEGGETAADTMQRLHFETN